MWLLNATSYKLEEYTPPDRDLIEACLISEDDLQLAANGNDSGRPPYTILSHRWQEGEVTMNDMRDPNVAASKPGWTKIELFCKHTRKDGFNHIWIDTCCIDKHNSVELSETINSMFVWYQAAEICYAYLGDCQTRTDMRTSAWFTRAWTLQELIAPRQLVLFNAAGVQLGTRADIAHDIAEACHVPHYLLRRPALLHTYSIATKMSWAAARRATRAEDRAYSLLGIFGVNIPPLYGEGGQRAFRRLQEEIIRTSNTHTIFAWSKCLEPTNFGLLALSPSSFDNRATIEETTSFASLKRTTILYGYVSVTLPVIPWGYLDTYVARLDCSTAKWSPFDQSLWMPSNRSVITALQPIYILLKSDGSNGWARVAADGQDAVDHKELSTAIVSDWRTVDLNVSQSVTNGISPRARMAQLDRAVEYGFDYAALFTQQRADVYSHDENSRVTFTPPSHSSMHCIGTCVYKMAKSVHTQWFGALSFNDKDCNIRHIGLMYDREYNPVILLLDRRGERQMRHDDLGTIIGVASARELVGFEETLRCDTSPSDKQWKICQTDAAGSLKLQRSSGNGLWCVRCLRSRSIRAFNISLLELSPQGPPSFHLKIQLQNQNDLMLAHLSFDNDSNDSEDSEDY